MKRPSERASPRASACSQLSGAASVPETLKFEVKKSSDKENDAALL